MKVELKTATVDDARLIHEMQVRAFMPLLEKYRDYDTSPANETVDRVLSRITRVGSVCHIIRADSANAGMLRVQKVGEGRYRVSPIFVLPEYQGKGVAQRAFALADDIYTDARVWELDTILQEKGNIHLYQKLGYVLTGSEKRVNERLTIVGFERRVNRDDPL